MRYVSPLRYPGGKRRLANFIKLVFHYNDLMDGYYIEPFAGGASIALILLFDEYASRVFINDLSKPIYALWHSILYETEALCSRIAEIDVTIEEWYRQKEIYSRADVSLLDLGFATLFLNRTNRSGIIEGGVIGGKTQTGRYKINARFNKASLIQRIKRIARYKERIEIYNLDAVDFIKAISPSLLEKTLIYLDPPYYRKSKKLYVNRYSEQDHLQIAKLLASLDTRWIISYDDVPEIRELYKGYQNITYSLSYSAADRYKGKEIMFFHHKLVVPPVKEPSRINSKRLHHWIQLSLI